MYRNAILIISILSLLTLAGGSLAADLLEPTFISYENKTVLLKNSTIVYYDVITFKDVNCTKVNYTDEKRILTRLDCDIEKVITTYNKTVVDTYGIVINTTNDKIDFIYSSFGNCSQIVTKDKVTIECDSFYDSNLDGKCTSGESCCIYECNKDGCDFGSEHCDLNNYITRMQTIDNKNLIDIKEAPLNEIERI